MSNEFRRSVFQTCSTICRNGKVLWSLMLLAIQRVRFFDFLEGVVVRAEFSSTKVQIQEFLRYPGREMIYYCATEGTPVFSLKTTSDKIFHYNEKKRSFCSVRVRRTLEIYSLMQKKAHYKHGLKLKIPGIPRASPNISSAARFRESWVIRSIMRLRGMDVGNIGMPKGTNTLMQGCGEPFGYWVPEFTK